VGREWLERVRAGWAAMVARRRERLRRVAGVARADDARRGSDWTTAVEGYRSYLLRRPRDIGVGIRLARTLHAAGRLDEAEVLIVALQRARPDKAELAELAASVRAARTASVPVAEYEAFRRALTLPELPPTAPPTALPPGRVTALIDARDASASRIELTRASLRRSEVSVDAVVVWSGDQPPPLEAQPVLLLDAGVTLDPRGLGWLLHAAQATGAAAAYGDDDQAVGEGEATIRLRPAFRSAFHPLDLATAPSAPAAILFRSGELGGFATTRDRRVLLAEAAGSGTVAHVPLVLATAHDAAGSPADVPTMGRDGPGETTILAIIPTRDEGAVLEKMIASLRSRASRPDRLDILVVDNGSRDPDTLALLARLGDEGRIRVLTIDEPFNWSRLNNLAAAGAGAEAEILLFANNDMQMLTEGWDDRLRQSLLLPGVGVVGARLVYPNGRIQHAGMALGALDGRPVHEGLGASPDDGGPLDRWRRNRPAAAVTGAFMGVRREVFEQVGGFNAVEFAVGCNDIDFCLRVREQGWSVLYAADLELFHLESHSRGHDDGEARMRRAQGELEALFRIWGDEARRDPGRNPHWVNHETLLYYGLRQPDREAAEAWIARSTDLWRVRRREG